MEEKSTEGSIRGRVSAIDGFLAIKSRAVLCYVTMETILGLFIHAIT
jgi:hypothetical protein